MEQTTRALDRKIEDSAKRLDGADTMLKRELHKEAAKGTALATTLGDVQKRLERFQERVGERFVAAQEDIAAGRNWTQQRLVAHADSLRRVNACLNRYSTRKE